MTEQRLDDSKVRLLASSLMKLIVQEFQNPSDLREHTYPKKQEAIDRFAKAAFPTADDFKLEWIGFLADDLVKHYNSTWEGISIPAIATLLHEMSGIWGNHSCNNFDLEEVLSNADDRRAVAREFHQLNGDPEQFDPLEDYDDMQDYVLMWFCSKRLRGEGIEN